MHARSVSVPTPGRVRDVAVPDGGTTSAAYTRRLAARSGARWKRVLDVQAPYRWNLRRLLGERRTLDVGCGIGRNLAHLPAGSVGVDHNATSVQVCREAGLAAFTVDEFLGQSQRPQFQGLLAAHLVEHLPAGEAAGVLAPYVPFLEPDAVVVLICPQERGFASDPTHTVFVDQPALAALAERAGPAHPAAVLVPAAPAGREAVHLQRVRHRRTPMTAEDVHAPVLRRIDPAELLVVLPALNEQDSVGRVVREVRAAQPEATVLVVDDGSTDATAERAAAAGAMVMRLPFNLGVGGAMRAGYRYGHDRGFAAVVQVDADGQHDAAEIEQLLAVPDADVVIGSRFAGRGEYAVRGPRRWAMRLLSRTLSGIVGTAVTDPTSGFRLVHRRAVALFAEHYPEEYLGDTVEALVVAHRAGLTIKQVPVAMRVRTCGRASTDPVRSAVYLLRVVVAVGLAMVRRAPR